MKYRWKGTMKFVYKGKQYKPGEVIDIDEELLHTPLKPLFEKVNETPKPRSLTLERKSISKTKKEVDVNGEDMESS